MTSKHGIEGLRVDVPTLDPDAVLLDRLSELSSAGARRTTTSRASSMKVLLAAAGVAVVTATTWVAAAVPGNPFPRPAHHPPMLVTPSASPSGGTATRTPGASDPTSKAPGSIHPTPDGRPQGAVPGAAPTVQGPGTRRQDEHTGHRHPDARQHDQHQRDPRSGWSDHHAPGDSHRHQGHSSDDLSRDRTSGDHTDESRTPRHRSGGSGSGRETGPP